MEADFSTGITRQTVQVHGVKLNHIVLNDAAAALKKLPADAAQLVIADPRYLDKATQARHLAAEFVTNLWRIPA